MEEPDMRELIGTANNDQEIRVFRAASRWCAIHGTDLGSETCSYGNDPVEAVLNLIRNKSVEERIEELREEFATICEIVERTCPGPARACKTDCPFSRLGYRCLKFKIRDLLMPEGGIDENRPTCADIQERTIRDQPENENRIRGVR